MTRYRQLFAVVIVLVAIAGYIVATRPMRRGLDLAGGLRVVYEARPEQGQAYNATTQSSILRILDRRLNGSGVAEPIIQPKGDRQFIVEIPDVNNKQEIAERMVRPVQLEFRYLRLVESDRNPNAPYTMGVPQGEDTQYTFTDRQGNDVPETKVLEQSEKILTGSDLKDNARADIAGMRSVVRIEFKTEGKDKFADFTRRHVDEILAIVLNGKILSAPKINEAILGGKAEISGMFTAEEAQALAEDLNAGALPVPLAIVEQNSVEATLGRQYVNQSVQAGIWGLALVVGFMVVYYLLPGFIAVLALAMYALFTFAIFKAMGVTMTLPGLAGFILSIGMAVDANILIFERMKEELRAGKTLHSAIDAGFNRAWTAILDSNVCTLITCLVLIALTSGPVVGFAKTLGIGVLVSMFTAVTVSRTLLHIITGAGFAQNVKLYGLGLQWGSGGSAMDIIGKRRIWFSFSIVLIAIGMYYLAQNGLQRGIEFTGGAMVQVSSPRALTAPEVTEKLAAAGYETQVQISKEATGTYTAYVRSPLKDAAKLRELGSAITDNIPGSSVVTTDLVGPSISREISRNAVIAVVVAMIAILIYLSVRFAQGGFVAGLRFGACALFALAHDVAIVLGASAVFGKLYGWEIDGSYVTAVLTMIGFSVHDTIVVFDRIRENQKLRLRGETFEQLANRSILQTFARSVNTSLTVIIVLATLLILGGSVIRHFNAVLLVGIVTGTYSSIFVASCLLVVWENALAKARGAAPVELKPLVERPTASARQTVGVGVTDDDSGGAEESGSEIAATDRPRGKAAPAKRRKRRF